MKESSVDIYMSLNFNERSEFIYDQIKDSYLFWKIKKAVKDELVKKRDVTSDLSSLIPKIMTAQNLDTKIKNKVQEVLDKNDYFKEGVAIGKNKIDTSFLPTYYKDKDYEPLESVANTKRIWNEQIKYKVNVISRTVRKPFI